MSDSSLNATGLVLGASNAQQVKLTSTASNLLQLQGTGSGVLTKLRGVDQPADDTDATSRSYVQTYVQTALRGLQMKQAVRLASQININLSGGSLEHSSTVLRRTAPPPNQNILTYADDYGNTIPLSTFAVSDTSRWTLGYIFNANGNQTTFYDDYTAFHFASSDFSSIGPAFSCVLEDRDLFLGKAS
jgi:hypothetical protein